MKKLVETIRKNVDALNLRDQIKEKGRSLHYKRNQQRGDVEKNNQVKELNHQKEEVEESALVRANNNYIDIVVGSKEWWIQMKHNSWTTSQIISILQNYPSGITETILSSELELMWDTYKRQTGLFPRNSLKNMEIKDRLMRNSRDYTSLNRLHKLLKSTGHRNVSTVDLAQYQESILEFGVWIIEKVTDSTIKLLVVDCDEQQQVNSTTSAFTDPNIINNNDHSLKKTNDLSTNASHPIHEAFLYLPKKFSILTKSPFANSFLAESSIRSHQTRIIQERNFQSVSKDKFTFLPNENTVVIVFHERTLFKRLIQTKDLSFYSLYQLYTMINNDHSQKEQNQLIVPSPLFYLSLKVLEIPSNSGNIDNGIQTTGMYLDIPLVQNPLSIRNDDLGKNITATLRLWYDQRKIANMLKNGDVICIINPYLDITLNSSNQIFLQYGPETIILVDEPSSTAIIENEKKNHTKDTSLTKNEQSIYPLVGPEVDNSNAKTIESIMSFEPKLSIQDLQKLSITSFSGRFSIMGRVLLNTGILMTKTVSEQNASYALGIRILDEHGDILDIKIQFSTNSNTSPNMEKWLKLFPNDLVYIQYLMMHQISGGEKVLQSVDCTKFSYVSFSVIADEQTYYLLVNCRSLLTSSFLFEPQTCFIYHNDGKQEDSIILNHSSQVIIVGWQFLMNPRWVPIHRTGCLRRVQYVSNDSMDFYRCEFCQCSVPTDEIGWHLPLLLSLDDGANLIQAVPINRFILEELVECNVLSIWEKHGEQGILSWLDRLIGSSIRVVLSKGLNMNVFLPHHIYDKGQDDSLTEYKDTWIIHQVAVKPCPQQQTSMLLEKLQSTGSYQDEHDVLMNDIESLEIDSVELDIHSLQHDVRHNAILNSRNHKITEINSGVTQKLSHRERAKYGAVKRPKSMSPDRTIPFKYFKPGSIQPDENHLVINMFDNCKPTRPDEQSTTSDHRISSHRLIEKHFVSGNTHIKPNQTTNNIQFLDASNASSNSNTTLIKHKSFSNLTARSFAENEKENQRQKDEQQHRLKKFKKWQSGPNVVSSFKK